MNIINILLKSCFIMFLIGFNLSYADSSHIYYQRYGSIFDENALTTPKKTYGIFITYSQKKLPYLVFKPLSIPRLACKIEIITNGHEQQIFITETINPFPIDNKYTYFTPIDFSELIDSKYKSSTGQITENQNFYIKNDPQCRIIYGAENFDEVTTNIINIPKKDIVNLT